MSFNDGKQLLVFGLSFAQHDNRKMQQLLRHYNRLPDNPGHRASLFLELNTVARELMAEEAAHDQIQQLTDWMTKGGDFPLGIAPAPTPSSSTQPQPAHDTSNGHRAGFAHHIPLLTGAQDHFGPGRMLSRQQNTSDQGHRYGRGRTMDGDWVENEHDEEEEQVETEENEDEMDHSMDEEEDNMHHPFGAFPFMAGQGGFDDSPGRNTFSGPGRILNDPDHPEQDSAAGSMNFVGQAADRPQNHPSPTGPAQFGAAVREFDMHLHESAQQHEEHLSTDSEDGSDDEPHEEGSSVDVRQEMECPICLEDYPRSRFPKHTTVTEFCDHPDKACLSCLESSIAAIIERGALHLLACPICPQKLTSRNIKEYASRAVYKRYKHLKEQSEIPGHWISCTNPICGGSQPHESEDPMMTCNHCNFATCSKHRRPWHEGQTCQEFDLDDAQIERLEEEEATAKLLAVEAISICPKCGQGVTKSDGCDHMRCQCGQEWCYVCSCSYDNIIRLGPTAHATFCTYHPNKVSLTGAQKDAARSRIMGLVHGGEVSVELARAREDLRRRRREEIRPKAAEAAEARMRLQREQDRGRPDGGPERKRRRVKLVAPWEEGGRTRKAL